MRVKMFTFAAGAEFAVGIITFIFIIALFISQAVLRVDLREWNGKLYCSRCGARVRFNDWRCISCGKFPYRFFFTSPAGSARGEQKRMRAARAQTVYEKFQREVAERNRLRAAREAEERRRRRAANFRYVVTFAWFRDLPDLGQALVLGLAIGAVGIALVATIFYAMATTGPR
jgi:hypothetical protein